MSMYLSLYLSIYVCMYACMHVCMHASCIYDDRLLPRYSETIFIFFVSVPLQIEKFAKVRTISISFQYQRNKGGFRTGVPKTTFPWKKPSEPSPKTKNKTRLCKGGNRTDPLIHVIMRPPKFSSRNATSPHFHS